MKLKILLRHVKKDHISVLNTSRHHVRVGDCFKTYPLTYDGQNYDLVFNLLTLDFKCQKTMPLALKSKIKFYILQADYLKWKFKKEGRAFFDFLRLYYDTYDHFLITDSESPDFIIHHRGDHGYEVTEATDAHNAKFNEALYCLTSTERDTTAYKAYIQTIQRKLSKKRINALEINPRRYYDTDELQKRIIQCISKKVDKYKKYQINLKTRNIIVFNNRIGFRRRADIEKLSALIKSNEKITASDIDRIFIVGGNHDILVAYNRFGKILRVKRTLDQ